MNGQTHIALGLIAAHALGAGDVASLAGAALGSLLPDIDGGGAIARPLESLLPKVLPRLPIIKAVDSLASTLSGAIRRVFGHRGVTHWPPIVAVGLGLVGLQSDFVLYFALGWLVHIYADGLTKNGVRLGLLGDRFKLPKWVAVRTGGMMEAVISACAWGYLAAIASQFVWKYVLGVLEVSF